MCLYEMFNLSWISKQQWIKYETNERNEDNNKKSALSHTHNGDYVLNGLEIWICNRLHCALLLLSLWLRWWLFFLRWECYYCHSLPLSVSPSPSMRTLIICAEWNWEPVAAQPNAFKCSNTMQNIIFIWKLIAIALKMAT